MSEFIRYKGVMSRIKGETKTVQRSKRIRTVSEITGSRLLRELTRLGFSNEKRYTLQQRFIQLNDLRYMNMKTLAVALLMYDEHPELQLNYDVKIQSMNINIESYTAVFNGPVMERYIGLLYPTPEKLKKRKIVSENDKQQLVVGIKTDLLRYILKIVEFLTNS